MKFRTVIHSTCTDYIPRNKAWVWIPWPWSLWCGSHCWETDRRRARAFWSDWFSSPGMVPPHAQRAVFWPPLEQNVQQWNTPGCERCLFLTVTVNGEPFSVQTKSKEQPHESTGVCWASHRLNSLSHRPCPWRDEDSRRKQWRGVSSQLGAQLDRARYKCGERRQGVCAAALARRRLDTLTVFVARSCLTVYDPVDYSPWSFSVHEFSRQEYWSGLPCPPPGTVLTRN